MREIKFRGKLSHSKQWIYGNLIIANNGSPYIIPQDVFEPDGHHLTIDSDNPYWVDYETVGQFTGLKDKNGIEIYEGDILLLRDYPISHHRIYYDSDLCCFSDYRIEDGDCNTNYYGFDFVKDCEVIDNIHDNPELLTKN